MTKNQTEVQKLMAACNDAMQFMPYRQRAEWMIWAAKFDKCTVCLAEPFSPCLSMTDIKKQLPREKCHINKQPHPSRVNWMMLKKGLEKRGYISR